MKVIFFGTIWPEPSASAAGVRTMSLLKVTREMGCEVHFCAPARLRMAPMEEFEEMGVRAHGLAAVNSSDVDQVVAHIQPDLVIFDRFITEEMFGWRVRKVCPGAAHVIDTQDLHFLRHARQHLVEEQLVASDPNLWGGYEKMRMEMESYAEGEGDASKKLNKFWNKNSNSFNNEISLLPSDIGFSSSRSNNPYKGPLGVGVGVGLGTFSGSGSSPPAGVSSHHHQHRSSAIDSSSSLINDVSYYSKVLSKYGPLLDQSDDPITSLVASSKKLNVLDIAKRYPVVHANMMRELAAIHRADLVLLVSHFEKDLLSRHLGIAYSKLEVAPFYYENIPHTTWKQYKSKIGFSMIGHFKHPPNRDGVHWLKNEIWPRIKRHMPSATIDIFGAHPEKNDMALSDPSSGFRVVGTLKAEELTSRLQRARVNLAPLRYGAGIKGKIADNWFSGTPSVTTSIGAESMTSYLRQSDGSMHQSFGGEIADTPDEFAKAAVQLYIDPTRWHRARAAGYEILTHNFNMAINGPLTQDALWRVVEENEKIRDQNLVGSILWSAGYRYNEMFGRFVQMKTLASQQHADKFVSDTKKAASASSPSSSSSTKKSNSISPNIDTSNSSSSNDVPSKPSESSSNDSSSSSHPSLPVYPTEKEDSEIVVARGLGEVDEETKKMAREISNAPKTSSSRSSPIISRPGSQTSQNHVKRELEDADRQFVFSVLAAEQERVATNHLRKSPSPRSPNSNLGLSQTDESAFVSFKKNLK